jgi:hypothetical protein
MLNFSKLGLLAILMAMLISTAAAMETDSLFFTHQSNSLESDNGRVLVAARRKKRRSKKRRAKPKPKPPPDPQPAEDPSSKAAPIPVGPGGRTRIEFDAQLIKGQTTKAGEVQILERRDSELKSMVKRRTSFVKEIIHTVFPEKLGE